MSIVVPHEGKDLLLEYMLNKTEPTEVQLKIFKNDITPDNDTVIGDFTETDVAGYAAKELAGASWTATDGVASFAEQIFTYTADETHYGYYVTNAGGTAVLWCELFDSAHVFPSGGGSEKITPTITLTTAV
jgi:hypothetical protein